MPESNVNPNRRGRPAGRLNVTTGKLLEREVELRKGGILPLDFFLRLMRNQPLDDPKDPGYVAEVAERAPKPPYPTEWRHEAARAAAPYVHKKMPQAVEMSGPNGGPIPVEADEVRAKLDAALARLAAAGQAAGGAE